MKMINSLVFSLCLYFQVQVINAGTVGIGGIWSFNGTVGLNDVTGNNINSAQISGVFDFDAGTVTLNSYQLFYEYVWNLDGSVSGNLYGSYFGDLVTNWSVNSFNTDMLWDITDDGNGTASLFTLDGDNDGYIGIAITDGPWIGWNPYLEGTLTAVPLPASIWLLFSGAIGLYVFARRKQ